MFEDFLKDKLPVPIDSVIFFFYYQCSDLSGPVVQINVWRKWNCPSVRQNNRQQNGNIPRVVVIAPAGVNIKAESRMRFYAFLIVTDSNWCQIIGIVPKYNQIWIILDSSDPRGLNFRTPGSCHRHCFARRQRNCRQNNQGDSRNPFHFAPPFCCYYYI